MKKVITTSAAVITAFGTLAMSTELKIINLGAEITGGKLLLKDSAKGEDRKLQAILLGSTILIPRADETLLAIQTIPGEKVWEIQSMAIVDVVAGDVTIGDVMADGTDVFFENVMTESLEVVDAAKLLMASLMIDAGLKSKLKIDGYKVVVSPTVAMHKALYKGPFTVESLLEIVQGTPVWEFNVDEVLNPEKTSLEA